MQVACCASAAPNVARHAAGGAMAPRASTRAAGGGQMPVPLRRAAAAAPLRSRSSVQRVSTRRGRGGVTTKALGGEEFPAFAASSFDAAASVTANLHASLIGSDALAPLFQVSDGAVLDAGAALDTVAEIPGLQKGGWLGPITDLLEYILEVRHTHSHADIPTPLRYSPPSHVCVFPRLLSVNCRPGQDEHWRCHHDPEACSTAFRNATDRSRRLRDASRARDAPASYPLQPEHCHTATPTLTLLSGFL